MAPWKSPKEGGAENGKGGGGEDAGDGVAQPENCLLLVVGPAEVRVPVGQVDKQGLSPLDQLACSSRQLGRSSRCETLCCWGVLGRRVTSCRQLVKLLQDRVHVVMRRLSRLFSPLLLRAGKLFFQKGNKIQITTLTALRTWCCCCCCCLFLHCCCCRSWHRPSRPLFHPHQSPVSGGKHWKIGSTYIW